MLRGASGLGIALVLAGCTSQLLFDDANDASTTDAAPSKDAATPQPPDGCGIQYNHVYYRPRGAQVMIMMDRSRSMQSSFGGPGETRQSEAQKALLSSVGRYQGKIKFGFEQFPADNNDSTYGDCQRGYCCAGKPEVEPNYNQSLRISGYMQCVDPVTSPCPAPSEGSHSSAALDQVRKYYEGKSKYYSADDDRYALLVTSSEPTCTSPAGGSACSDALESASYLGDMGIRVVVLSVGYVPGTGSCLVQLSLMGSTRSRPEGMDTLYEPDDSASLGSDVDEIMRSIATTACTFETSQVPPPPQAQPKVYGDNYGDRDTLRPDFDAENGWSYATPDRTSVKLSGQACEQYLRSASFNLAMSYSCSSCGGDNACP